MAMIHNCPLHTVLISTIGKTPQVLVETVWSLANQKNPIVPDEIIAVSMANFAEDARESVFGKGAGWKKLISNLRKSKIAIAEKLKFKEVTVATDSKGPIDDLRTTEDNMRCADYLFELIRKYTLDDSTRIILSLSGGRKSLSALATVTMSLLARPQDSLIHLIVDSGIENDGQYHFPHGGKGYSLFEIPFVRTRGLIEGVDINEVRSFYECRKITQERLVGVQYYPKITLNATKASLTVEGHEHQAIVDIDGSRFLFLWLLFKMKRLDTDLFMKSMCKAHALKEIENSDAWFRRFQSKSDKFLDAATIECARNFAKVKSETMRDVIGKCGLTPMQCKALYPRTKNGKPIPFEFAIVYPPDRLDVVDTDCTLQLAHQIIGDIP